MRSITIAVALLGFISAFSVSVESADTTECKSNSMFEAIFDKAKITIPKFATPGNSTGVCPFYSGKPQCCDSKMNELAAAVIKKVDTEFETVASHVDDVNAETIVAALKLVASKEPNFPIPASEITVDVIKPFVDPIIDLIKPSLYCMRGVYAELRGLLCFACEPDWTKYYDTTANPPKLSLSTNSCDGLYGACEAFVHALNNFKDKMISIAKKNIAKAGVPIPPELSVVADTGICKLAKSFEEEYDPSITDSSIESDVCKDLVCTYLGDPLGYAPNNNGPNPLSVLDEFAGRSGKSDALEFKAGPMRYIAKHLAIAYRTAKMVNDIAKRPAESHVEIKMLAHRARGAGARAVRVAAAPKPSVDVEYTASGYPAYKVGCDVKVSNDANCDVPKYKSGGGGLGAVGGVGGLIGIIVGSVVVVGLLAAVVVVVKKKNSPSSAGYNQSLSGNAHSTPYQPPQQQQQQYQQQYQ